ncbi:syntaxin-binding protein 2 [Globomyces pollinis-pini]|nr:syntaxin-binding protein 2 [Globomyces pollinis-pini]
MSLKEFLKDKLLSQVLAKVNPPGRWKILVVDSLALFLLDSTCKMSEILNQNVTVVEGLLNKRQPYPDKDAIYLISPSLNSVQALINDFSNRPVYRAAHVFCLSGILSFYLPF